MDDYEKALLLMLDSAPVPSRDMSTDELLLFLNDYYDWYKTVQEVLDELYETEESDEG